MNYFLILGVAFGLIIVFFVGYHYLVWYACKDNPLLQATENYLAQSRQEVADFLNNRYQEPVKQMPPKFMGTIKVVD